MNWHDDVAAIWRGPDQTLRAVRRLDQIKIADLIGVDEQAEQLLANTRAFLADKPAEHALLWGARGTGKSSLIKAVFNAFVEQPLRLIQLAREDMVFLPHLVEMVEDQPYRFIVFCDDLVFGVDSREYRILRTFLQGSVELPPSNLIIYATSNLRYILPQDMAENSKVRLRDMEPQYSQETEDRLALADRFGLWLSFYPPNMENYLQKVQRELKQSGGNMQQIKKEAEQFARKRAVHNYRTADQFIRQYLHRQRKS